MSVAEVTWKGLFKKLTESDRGVLGNAALGRVWMCCAMRTLDLSMEAELLC